jgi:hypothetical protein
LVNFGQFAKGQVTFFSQPNEICPKMQKNKNQTPLA